MQSLYTLLKSPCPSEGKTIVSRPLTKLRIWMNAATSSEQQHLADAIGTSRAMLYQYASGHREVSAARGGEIEAVSKLMSRASKGRLPVLYRTDLVPF